MSSFSKTTTSPPPYKGKEDEEMEMEMDKDNCGVCKKEIKDADGGQSTACQTTFAGDQVNISNPDCVCIVCEQCYENYLRIREADFNARDQNNHPFKLLCPVDTCRKVLWTEHIEIKQEVPPSETPSNVPVKTIKNNSIFNKTIKRKPRRAHPYYHSQTSSSSGSTSSSSSTRSYTQPTVHNHDAYRASAPLSSVADPVTIRAMMSEIEMSPGCMNMSKKARRNRQAQSDRNSNKIRRIKSKLETAEAQEADFAIQKPKDDEFFHLELKLEQALTLIKNDQVQYALPVSHDEDVSDYGYEYQYDDSKTATRVSSF